MMVNVLGTNWSTRAEKSMAGKTYVDHRVLAQFAQDHVNVPVDEAGERRAQVNHLRRRLELHIAKHPEYDLVKLRASGSTAKHTAIRRRKSEGSDADVAAYLRTGDIEIDEHLLLEWLLKRCREVYGETKDEADFAISQHAVGITMRGSGLKIDVAPVLYTGEPDDKGFLVTRQGQRVLTSVTLHLRFIEARKREAGRGYAELIRLLKAWIRWTKTQDSSLRCKSFLLELLVAHLWESGWHSEALQVNDYPRAFEQVLSYIATTGLKTPILFDDYYDADEVITSSDPIQVWDPVNPGNNVASSYNDMERRRLVDAAASALDSVSWAAMAPTKAEAADAWRELFGPTFPGV